MGENQIYNIPNTEKERNDLRSLISDFVYSRSLSPPLSMFDLLNLSGQLISDQGLDSAMQGWMMVEVNNAVWQETVASVPYEKRILLLPKCLSNSKECEAEVDELGLLCHRCNRCSIPDLQDKAEELGMLSIVAEGFTSVIGLIENRVVDTVIGVGCLDSLEKAFPLLIDNAVPGLAIPLNMAGCKDTTVDYGYVERLISMQSGKEAHFLDYDRLKSSLKKWFSQEKLTELMSPADNQTSAIAQEWLGGDGKRWRPYLLAATYLALSGEKEAPLEVQLAAIAVECFHKASLVHDDIQDDDMTRYGKKTVNAAYGVPIAINVGDVLLGEGYRLLTGTKNMKLLEVAANAHISLCKGQGMELEWSASPRALSIDFVLDVFINKTVPAFDVSLIMGVICAGENTELQKTLTAYSKALGIAYQLQDDLEDFETDSPLALRPSAVIAVLYEKTDDEAFRQALLLSEDLKSFLRLPENSAALDSACEKVKNMAEKYHQEALDVLHQVNNIELKRLLFRVTKKILK